MLSYYKVKGIGTPAKNIYREYIPIYPISWLNVNTSIVAKPFPRFFSIHSF